VPAEGSRMPSGSLILRAVMDSACPRIWVPNAGDDPEMRGYGLGRAARKRSRVQGA
jgi:hypothetical protein